MGLLNNNLNAAGNPADANSSKISGQLPEMARKESDIVLNEIGSRLSGLTTAEAETRARQSSSL
jgi:hypothetical protein